MSEKTTQFNSALAVAEYLNAVTGVVLERLQGTKGGIPTSEISFNLTRILLECLANRIEGLPELEMAEMDFIDGMQDQLDAYLEVYPPAESEEQNVPDGVTLQ